MSDLKTVSLFDTFVYQAEIPKYLDNKDFMAACNEHTDKAIAEAKETIEDRHKKLNAPIKDHGMSYHSGAELYKDERFAELVLLVKNTSKNILEDQGFELTNYVLSYTEMWIQKFAYEGGGHQDTHVHWDNHISGFYFVECSDKTSKSIFHDPRSGCVLLWSDRLFRLNQVHYCYLIRGYHINLVWTMALIHLDLFILTYKLEN